MPYQNRVAKRLFVTLALSVALGMVIATITPLKASSLPVSAPEGVVSGEMLLTTSAKGDETLVTPLRGGTGLAFRVQHVPGTVVPTGYAGSLTIRYTASSLEMVLPDGRGWFFELQRDGDLATAVPQSAKVAIFKARGLQKFANDFASWGSATPLDEICPCPSNDPDDCQTGGGKAKTCSLTCFNQPGMVGGCDKGACCWCDSENKGVCAKCCFGGQPEGK
jgi:hypothetical protein